MSGDIKSAGPEKEAMLDFIFCFSQGENLICINGIDFFYYDFLITTTKINSGGWMHEPSYISRNTRYHKINQKNIVRDKNFLKNINQCPICEGIRTGRNYGIRPNVTIA